MTENNNKKTGNKGEWSEFYAFVKILTDGRVFTADENLEILKNKSHLVLKIIREERGKIKSYDISKNDGNIIIRDGFDNNIGEVEVRNIKSGVVRIFEAMKNERHTTFRILPAEKIMKELHCSQIKASSGKKVDLVIVLHDKKSPTFPKLGFSIKSMLGSPSTLLNASGATNFVFKIIEKGKSGKDENFGSKDGSLKIRDKTKNIYEAGGNLEFVGMDSDVFRRNLRKVDSNFPLVIAEILKHYYSGKGTKISDLVDCLVADKILCNKLDFTKDDYVFKIKNFLIDVALGMMPNKEWDGNTEAHGGYIIVKENGEIVCYHLFNRDEFANYLYNNVKLDTPSTKKHKFGNIYVENGERKIKYNLQIRFIK